MLCYTWILHLISRAHSDVFVDMMVANTACATAIDVQDKMWMLSVAATKGYGFFVSLHAPLLWMQT